MKMKQVKILILTAGTLLMTVFGCRVSEEAASTASEEQSVSQQPPSFVGFYDQQSDGTPRPIRNDLEGNLPGMVQFVQSHTVDPFTTKQYVPQQLTSKREALLLVTPDTSAVAVENLQVAISINGIEKATLEMRPPHEIFKADQPESVADSRPDIRYSGRAWSVVLPWKWVKPGLSLTVTGNQGRSGAVFSQALKFAPPAELVINNIRLGLLTDPPKSKKHAMYLRPAVSGTDYFQTAPLSKMVVAKYDEVTLDSVMVADGTIYDEASDDEGGVYSGDMRQNTAKSTFSVGTNLANWGITSSTMGGEQQPQLTQTVIVHHAQGKYQNGVEKHGLSGGNGMLTLLRSTGNEFSHEIGHHYGLGHYPGKEGGWTYHDNNCCWGYIGHKKRMRANLNWTADMSDLDDEVPTYNDQYAFLKGSMSGGIGGSASAFSNYTHYTGYEIQTRIIPSLNRAMFDPESSTGYSKWNAEAGIMEDYLPKVPSSDEVWYNSSNGYYRVPQRQGVKVFTILGGYDPVEGKGLLYPPARSNWGNVFDLPAPDANATSRQCWLTVDYAQKQSKKIALAPKRMGGSNANKLHVQVAVDQQPEQARLYCQEGNENVQLLSQTDFPQNLDPIADPVVIGQEEGYKAYNKVQSK
jgi:hypothetical protein